MRTLFLATAAFAALMVGAPIGTAHADNVVEPHQNVIDECPLNDSGEALLKNALMTARYDITSKAYLGMHILGFGANEFTNRTESEQMDDVKIRTARALSGYNDGVMLPMAQARDLDEFFYNDSLACLKHAYHADAEPAPSVTHGGEVKVIVTPTPAADTHAYVAQCSFGRKSIALSISTDANNNSASISVNDGTIVYGSHEQLAHNQGHMISETNTATQWYVAPQNSGRQSSVKLEGKWRPMQCSGFQYTVIAS
jgi:hypothetical protein